MKKIILILITAILAGCGGIKSGVDQVKKDQKYYNYDAAMKRLKKSDKKAFKIRKKSNK